MHGRNNSIDYIGVESKKCQLREASSSSIMLSGNQSPIKQTKWERSMSQIKDKRKSSQVYDSSLNNQRADLTVREVVFAYRRKKNVNGVDGYNLPDFNAHLDKTLSYKIPDNKKKSYLDDVIKLKSIIPPPYDVCGSLINPKKQSGLPKGVRMTLPLEIEKQSKRDLKPGPGAYEQSPRGKIIGAYNFKSEKITFIEEAQYLGSQSQTSYDVKYNQVQSRVLDTKLVAPKEQPSEKYKITKNDKPSPTSYEAQLAHKFTSKKIQTFTISRTQNQTLVDQYIKSKKHLPGAGTYNAEISFDKITKGANRGWK